MLKPTNMPNVLSMFSYTPENVGDMACSWGNAYARYYPTNFAHINDVRSDYKDYDLVVVGGGGIINKSHEEGIWRAITKSKKCLVRSVGVKDWDFAKKLRDKLGKNFTIRHQVEGFIYEPCPSLFEIQRYKIVHGINGIIPKEKDLLFAMHQNNVKEIEQLIQKGCDVIVNNCNFAFALDKISKAKKVVTSSYHFLIWAEAFGCEIEFCGFPENFKIDQLDPDSDLRKFFYLPIKFDCINISKYLN